jgi:hypothetical protein
MLVSTMPIENANINADVKGDCRSFVILCGRVRHDIRKMSALKRRKTGSSSSEATSVEGMDDGGTVDDVVNVDDALKEECQAFLHGISMDNIEVSRDAIEACSDQAFLNMCVTLCEGCRL